MNAKQHPDAILAELKAKLGTRAKRNLDTLHKVCSEIHNSSAKEKDYSLTVIGRRTEELGGPALNTLHSKFGAHFRDLIKAWADYDGAPIKKPSIAVSPGRTEGLLTRISDPALRSLIAKELAKGAMASRELVVLKAQANAVVDNRPKEAQGTGTALLIEPSAKLTSVQAEAIEIALDEKWQRSHGIVVGANGEVKVNGHRVFPSGFMDAVRILNDGSYGAKDMGVSMQKADK